MGLGPTAKRLWGVPQTSSPICDSAYAGMCVEVWKRLGPSCDTLSELTVWGPSLAQTSQTLGTGRDELWGVSQRPSPACDLRGFEKARSQW